MADTSAVGRGSGVLPGALVGICATLLLGCGAALCSPRQVLPLVADSPAGMVRTGALLFVAVGLVVLAWWLFSLAAGVLAELLARCGHARAAARAARWSPDFMRRLAAALLGAHLLVIPAAQAAGPGAPAVSAAITSGTPGVAGSVGGADSPTATWASRDLPSPAWTPERQAPPMNRLMGQQNRSALDDRGVVVGPGDSLWSIAARVAGPGASDAEVAREWPRWYHANRAVIGPDPDLLHIGTVLTPPRAE